MRPEPFFGKSDSWACLDRLPEARTELQRRRTDFEGFLPCPPRFRLRTLMITVPLAGVVLAIEAAAWTGPLRQVLVLVLPLSIAWVPAVFLLLSLKAAGWLFPLAVSASISSLAFSLYHTVHGGLGRDSGISTCLLTLWLTFAFGIGYVATKGLHLPDRHQSHDTRPETDSQADR